MAILRAPNEPQNAPLVCDIPLPCSSLQRCVRLAVLAKESLERAFKGSVKFQQEILCVEAKARALTSLSVTVETTP
jgi:hypothetical protein